MALEEGQTLPIARAAGAYARPIGRRARTPGMDFGPKRGKPPAPTSGNGRFRAIPKRAGYAVALSGCRRKC